MEGEKQESVQQQQPVVTQQPTAQRAPMLEKYREQTGTEEWKNGVWDCFAGGFAGDDNLCLKATFCPCFVHGKISARMRDPTLTNYNRFNEDCLLYAAGNYCAIGWIFHFMKRSELREGAKIKGDILSDCLLSACCHCCSLIQVEKEVIARSAEIPVGGYTKPNPMRMEPSNDVASG